MKTFSRLRLTSRLRRLLAISMMVAAPLAQAGLRETSVALDAVYIPALFLTSAAQADPGAADKARKAVAALETRWQALMPGLRQELAGAGGARTATARKTVEGVHRHIQSGARAVAAGQFKAAHEALEEVRVDLLQARRAVGLDYFVDRLTAFHEPMEVLALAGTQLKPGQLTPVERARLEQAYVHARALWHQIEAHRPDLAAHGLTGNRAAQFMAGMAAETDALARLSDALRGADAAALLRAASAIKPPFAKVFTAFGQTS